MTIEQVKELLRELGFPEGYTSDQMALTVLALADRHPRPKLLPGHASLAEGARVHDILNFVREDMGRRVAENTRESYRKTSLRPLVEAGWVVRHQLSTNDPNTYYTLNGELARLLEAPLGPDRDRLVERLRRTGLLTGSASSANLAGVQSTSVSGWITSRPFPGGETFAGSSRRSPGEPACGSPMSPTG